MSIIKALQEFIQTYDGIELRPIPKVNTDQTGLEPSSYSIAPSGNGKSSTDVAGNKTFINNYVFYARECAADESDRSENYDFLEDFSDWIEEQNDMENFPVLTGRYIVEEMEVSNAILFDIDEDGLGLYQVQLKLTITKKKGAI